MCLSPALRLTANHSEHAHSVYFRFPKYQRYMVEEDEEERVKVLRKRRKTESKEVSTCPSRTCCQGDSLLLFKRRKMNNLGKTQVKAVMASGVMASASGNATEGREITRSNLRPSEAGGEGRRNAVEVGESEANGGVERGDRKVQVTQRSGGSGGDAMKELHREIQHRRRKTTERRGKQKRLRVMTLSKKIL